MQKVVFFPDWREGNPYLSLLATGIEQQSYHVDFLHYESKSFFPINAALVNKEKPDVVHLHWLKTYLESLIWSSNSLFFYLRLLFIFFDIVFLKIRGIKVVWTVHNLIEHDSQDPKKELTARKLLAKLCRIVVHSEDARSVVAKKYSVNESALSVIPHGNYVGYYPCDAQVEKIIAEKLNFDRKGKHVFLFLGSIRRYKGVNNLVDAFVKTKNDQFILIIAGNPFREQDRQWLTDIAQTDPRIKLSLGFIPESEICAYLNLCDVVVLPFVNTLTSGSAILAMSYRKALILPEHAKVFSLPEKGVIYYSAQQGLEWAFKQFLLEDIKNMGNINYSYVSNFSFTAVAKLLVDNVYK